MIFLLSLFNKENIMTILRFIFAFAILISSHLAYSQTSDSLKTKKERKYIKYLDFSIENGAILGNDDEMSDQIVNSSYYNGLDIKLGFRKANKDDVYATVYRRPYIGLGWYSSTFNNADIGNPNALYFYLNFPFAFEGAKKFTFSYTAAFGLSYNFNPYDPVNNPTNVFVGSYRNCYVHLGFMANYKVAPRWLLNATLGFKHFSNGSFKQPNYGLNLIPFSLGVSYRLNQQEVYLEKTRIPEYKPHNLVNIAAIVGSKNYEIGGDNYLKATLSVNFLRQINYKYRIGLGMDLFYSAESELRNDSDKSAFSKSFSTAIVGSWEWALTKILYVPIGIGFYLSRNPENDEKTFYYERVGLRYRFLDHYFAGLTIKAHGGAADIFEWTIGYTFHHDKNKY